MITDYSKQTELIKVHEFKTSINIIGAGALGSWVAFILLKMGFENITIYDFDKIEEHNIPNQLFKESQIGEEKVVALEEIYEEFFDDNATKRLNISKKKVDSSSPPLHGVILCCVDTMSGREEIYENLFKLNPHAILWIEGRLSIYGAYVYSLTKESKLEEYEKTLYADEEAEVSACGVSQTALPAAINAATIMIMQMIEWHNNTRPILNAIEYAIPDLVAIKQHWK